MFTVLTGNAYEKIVKKKVGRLWSIIKFIDENNDVFCSYIKNLNDVDTFGLVDSHTYTLINS